MYFERVLKFGGAALADGPSVERACRIIAEQRSERPIVVVSAHAGVTDMLQTVARAAAGGGAEADRVRIRHRTLLSQLGLNPELLDRHFTQLYQLLAEVERRGRIEPSQLDMALSFGERMSARVVAKALERHEIQATPVDAYDLGFVTDSNYGQARPLEGIEAAIREAVAQVPGIPIITGFLAKDRNGNLTTLGRNGSDLTASVIAEAVGAAEIQYWKSVGGILTADPEVIPDATVIERLTYAEAAECAFYGARILHPAAVAPALRARVSVRVLNVNEPDSYGTVFEQSARRDGPVAIASRRGVVRIEVPLDQPERRAARIARLFSVLEECGITPGLLSANGERAFVAVDEGPALATALVKLGPDASVTRSLAVVAAVGEQVGRYRALALRALDLLTSAGVEPRQAFLGRRATSQAFLVDESEFEHAVRTLHDGMLARASAR